jgi:P4 family phage/plasmid primase-like protien
VTPEQSQALDIARALAASGIPVFLAWPDPAEASTGYKLPSRWQTTEPDPSVVDAWRPGMALCAVMGRGLDLVDVDTYKGSTADVLTELDGKLPVSYAAALTPSGGVHSFVRSMGVRSKNGVLPGVDVKAGDAEGKGRGFAFIAPTVRVSKSTGQPAPYRWVTPPDVTRLAAVLADPNADLSGAQLAQLVEASRTPAGPTPAPDADAFMRNRLAGLEPDVVRQALSEGRNNGVAKLAAALRGRGGLELADAIDVMYRRVWPLVDQAAGGHDFTAEEFESTITAAWRQYDDGAEQRAAAAAVPPTPDGQGGVEAPPNPSRYLGPGGLQAATLAGDVLALGPLRQGTDHIMWTYGAGVWRPDRRVVRNRAARLMGERYRPSHGHNAEEIVLAYVDTITCDPIPQLVNFRNGLLDWAAPGGPALLPHTPDVPSTVQLAVDYDPGAHCPAFEKFLHEVLPPDMVETAWELVGYLMYSGNPLHKAVMLSGQGRNGKGTFLRVMLSLLGRRNVTTVSLHDLVNTRFTTASLFGKLANIAGDIDAGYLENTATFKAITGGDTISAEHKGRDRFDFTPWAVPVFSANKIPASADTTSGYLDRWLVVPFPNSFSGREDRWLDAKLHTDEELRGIAARGIAALAGLLERGDFELSESALAAREDFVRRVDQVRTWLSDCAHISTAEPHHPWVARTELYEAYKRWAVRDGHKALRASEFYDRIEAAGAEPAIVHGTRGFKRIRVIDEGWVTVTGHTPQLPQEPTAEPARQTPTGAAGAGHQGTNSEDADLGADASAMGADGAANAAEPTLSGLDSAESCTQPAPTQKPALTSANTQVTHESGAQGAETPHPPSRVRTQGLGWARPAPPAPKGFEGSLPKSGVPDASGPGAEAKAPPKPGTKAAARLEAQRAAFEAAAGPRYDLPAVATRDGAVLAIAAADARALLDTVTAPASGVPGALTVDVEHTGYPVGHADFRLKTVQLGIDAFAVVLDPADADQAEVVRHELAAAPVLHAHSATADLVPLGHAGLLGSGPGDAAGIESAWDRMHDTVIPAKLADPASTGSNEDLKGLSAAVLGQAAVSPAADRARAELFKAGKWLTNTEVTTPPERSGWAQVDAGCATMVRYAAGDVLDDAALAKRLPQPAPEVLERERIAQRMTARVTHRGLRIDGDHVRDLLAKHRPLRAAAAERIRDCSGGTVDNPGSNPQVAAALTAQGLVLPRTPTGRPSVKADVLDPLRDLEGPAGELVRAVLDYREHDKAIGTYLEPYERLVLYGDGRARPTIYTLEADTGRMSSVRPNAQNIPRVGGFRACLTADIEPVPSLLVSADFAGVELRSAAALSQDRNLIQMLANGVDLHWEIARQVFGPNATKSDRYQVKRGVFGRLYGGGVPTLAKQVGVSEQVAGAMVDTLDAMTPGLTEWSRHIREGVKAGRTKFQTYSGRVVHLPPAFPHKGPNYCIQGTARELLVDALIRWRDTRWGDCTLLPVHDELVAVVPQDDAAQATEALVACMQTELFGIPIVVEASEPSFAWADAA